MTYLLQSIGYWQKYNPNIYSLLESENTRFNEDVGEVLNGMLSRKSSQSFSFRADVLKMSEVYMKLDSSYVESGSYRNKKSTKSKPHNYSNSPIVRKLIVHLTDVIENIYSFRNFEYANIGTDKRVINTPVLINVDDIVPIFRKTNIELKACANDNLLKLYKLLTPRMQNMDDISVDPNDDFENDHTEDIVDEVPSNHFEIEYIITHDLDDQSNFGKLKFKCCILRDNISSEEWIDSDDINEVDHYNSMSNYFESLNEIPLNILYFAQPYIH